MNGLKELERELGRNLVLDKNEKANNKHQILRDELIAAGELTEEAARVLGCELLAYYCEAVLHNGDRITIEIEAAKLAGIQSGWEEGTSHKKILSERFRAERALIPTAQGDYREVKKWYQEEAERSACDSICTLYSSISVKIPDFGANYTMPTPTWVMN